MSTRLSAVVVEAVAVGELAGFWAEALGWELGMRGADGTQVVSPGNPGGVGLLFVPSTRAKVGKNRVHLDVAGGADQQGEVGRLLALGAVRADIGQGDVPWDVLADPEGNEFCVLPEAGADGRLVAICQDAADPDVQGRFWAGATGWRVVDQGAWGVSLRSPSGAGPRLVMGPPVTPKFGTNRLQLGLRAGPELSVERPTGMGASEVRVDPEGNEFQLFGPGDELEG